MKNRIKLQIIDFMSSSYLCCSFWRLEAKRGIEIQWTAYKTTAAVCYRFIISKCEKRCRLPSSLQSEEWKVSDGASNNFVCVYSL